MKSLRQLAKEIGVSAAYLSQVNHGKVRMSPRVAKLLSSDKQNSIDETPKTSVNTATRVYLKSSALKRLVGSRPSPGTSYLASLFKYPAVRPGPSVGKSWLDLPVFP